MLVWGEGIWTEPIVAPFGRENHGHPIVDPRHFHIGRGGDDRGLKVIAYSFPDTGKGQW